MNDSNLNQNVSQLLSLYGFKFVGNDESGKPLFTAPNGQIVTYKIVYDFILQQERLRNQNQVVSANPETINMPTSIEVVSSPETTIEKVPEQEKQVGVVQEPNNNQLNTQQTILVQAPKIVEKPKELPFGDGYKPKSFDASSLESTRSFVSKNVTKPDNLSNKWLAVQFRKFIEQYEEKLKK